MTDLPAPVQARIETILAETELAIIDIQRTPEQRELMIVLSRRPSPEPEPREVAPSHAERILAVVLRAVADIIQAVRGLPARDRRETVEHYREVLAVRYAISPPRLRAAVQTDASWLAFQRSLAEAEQTDIPSVGQQLRTLMDEACWAISQLHEATRIPPKIETGIPERTIERLLGGQGSLQPTTRDILQQTFTRKLGRPIVITVPPRPPRRRVGKKSVKRR
jgi:hypothetical protein